MHEKPVNARYHARYPARDNANQPKTAQRLCAEQILDTHPASNTRVTLSASSISVEHQESSCCFLIKVSLGQYGRTRQS